MKLLKLIQIGDIHFPDLENSVVLDSKDRGLSSPLLNAISPVKLQNVARQLLNVLEDPTVVGLLICGDLTSRGALKGYTECLRFLDRLLELHDATKISDEHIHVVPGNHDVDRKLCQSNNVDIFQKFEPLEQSWTAINRSILTARKLRHTSILSEGRRINLFSLNSCIGCGETRSLPHRLSEELREVLDNYVKDKTWEEAFSVIGEQLDTPAFVEEHMTTLIEEINRLDPKSFPIVLAHHNILPQATPRIDIYTEVINGGLVRSRLIECKTPVLYCHGHIHTDPIEVVTSPRDEAGFLISVSAPMFGDGFNVIEINYGQQDFPLGCTVNAYRIRQDGAVSIDKSKTVRIPFRRPADYSTCGHDRMGIFLRHIEPGAFSRLSELLPIIRSSIGSEFREKTFTDVLLEAEWFQLIRILDRDKDPRFWQIMKLVP